MRNWVLLGCLLASFLGGCNDSSDVDGEIKTFELAAYKQECGALFFFTLCPRGRSLGTTQWRGMVAGTGGLDFEWGYEYTIRVRDTPIENPPADSYGFTRELVEVVRKTPVASGTEFTIESRASDPLGSAIYIEKLQEGKYLFYRNTEVECFSPQTCDRLDAAIEMDLKFLATFEFRAELGLPIILREIVCTEPNDDFVVQCGRMAGLETGQRSANQLLSFESQQSTSKN